MFPIHRDAYGSVYDSGTAYAIHEEYVDTYSIRSEMNKVWLPATSTSGSGVSGASEPSFYLEDPPPSGASGASGTSSHSSSVSSISLSDFRSRVKAMDDLVKEGEGVTGYRECLIAKRFTVRDLSYQSLTATGPGPYFNFDLYMSSGLSVGSVVDEGQIFGGKSREYSKAFFTGPDADLFMEEIEDNDNDPSTGYSEVTKIKRPLPRGTYEVHYNAQSPVFFPCDFHLEPYPRWYVHVAAPDGTLHEAFFDPVADTSTSAIGADGENGVLKPASFTFEGVGTTTIERIEWGSSRTRMELSSPAPLTDYHIDFIALDGSVSLRLDFDDATATTTEGGGSALIWGVCDQPWQDGDLLMIRMSESPADLSGAINDRLCVSNPVSLPTPAPPGPWPRGRSLAAEATHDSVTLSWEALDTDAVTGYRILRQIQGQSEFRQIAEVGRDSTVYVDTTDIAPNTHYIYRIRAIVAEGAEPVADSRVAVVTPASQ